MAATVNDSLVVAGFLDDVGGDLDGQAMSYVTIKSYYAHAEASCLMTATSVSLPSRWSGGTSQATTRSAGAAA